MKKQFFYAAMAIVFMASCTSEDNVALDQPTPDAEDKVAIELGIDAPTVNASVSGRAVGSVGDIADAASAQVKKNIWNGQKLFIAMIDNDKESATYGELAKEGEGESATNILFNNYHYYAPRGEEATNSGSIRIYGSALANGNDNGILQRVYYPVQGQFDFLGWHVDDAGTTENPVTPNITKEAKTVKNIIITGQQDIMGARTKKFTEENYWTSNDITAEYDEMVGWNFSARTARNKIHPKLEFKHQLARLKFFVKAGSESAAEYIYTPAAEGQGGTWAKRPKRTQAAGNGLQAVDATEAMYVKSITATGMLNNLTMDLAATDEDGNIFVDTKAATDATGNFSLLSRNDETGEMKTTLDLVAPAIWTKATSNLDEENDEIPAVTETPEEGGEAVEVSPAIDLDDFKKGTPVGESIMFLPFNNAGTALTELNLTMELQQVVELTDNEAITVGQPKEEGSQEVWTDADKYTWGTKTQSANLKVRASDVVYYVEDEKQYATAFEPGKSYNVYITIYGFEKIVITAELTAWDNGGNVEVDIEDKVSNSDNPANQEGEEENN